MASIQKQILDIVGARLALRTIANGYVYDAGRIDRAKTTAYSVKDLPATNYWAGQDELNLAIAGSEQRQLKIVVESYQKTKMNPL